VVWLSLKEAEIAKGEWVAPELGGQTFQSYSEGWMHPCNIKGAGKEHSAEREIVPLPVVFQLADTVPVRYRALILLATFADMRWGELAGLRRENIDLENCEVKITEELVQPNKGPLFFDTPKSQAGNRTVAFPEEIAGEIRWHLDRFG
jgi:hypothetical protein